MKTHTLILIGSGIKFMSHLTFEARNCIEKADKVLYLVNEPAMMEWLKKANSTSESLDPFYSKNFYREENYLKISDYILSNLKKYETLCVVLYGHPTMLVQPSLYAANAAKTAGFNVAVIPGISSLDCLFADLLIDPGNTGFQSYEATDLLIYKRVLNPYSHLIIWQPYVIGILHVTVNHNPEKGLEILMEYLKEKYDIEHNVILYEAAQYPTFKPKIEIIKLKHLPSSNLTRLTTLYIPPLEQNNVDSETINKFNCLNSSLHNL